MSLQILRLSTDRDAATEIRSRLVSVFDELSSGPAQHMSYTAYINDQGTDFILVLDLDDATINPLLALPEAARLRETIGRAVGRAAAPEVFSVVGSYQS